MSIEIALQKAIWTRLGESSDLPALYENVPQKDGQINADWPFVSIGDDTHAPWDTDDSVGSESTITIHAWARYGGRAAVKAIQAVIYELLHRHELDLEVEGFSAVAVEFEYSEALEDPDGVTWHGVQRFRIYIERPV